MFKPFVHYNYSESLLRGKPDWSHLKPTEIGVIGTYGSDFTIILVLELKTLSNESTLLLSNIITAAKGDFQTFVIKEKVGKHIYLLSWNNNLGTFHSTENFEHMQTKFKTPQI